MRGTAAKMQEIRVRCKTRPDPTRHDTTRPDSARYGTAQRKTMRCNAFLAHRLRQVHVLPASTDVATRRPPEGAEASSLAFIRIVPLLSSTIWASLHVGMSVSLTCHVSPPSSCRMVAKGVAEQGRGEESVGLHLGTSVTLRIACITTHNKRRDRVSRGPTRKGRNKKNKKTSRSHAKSHSSSSWCRKSRLGKSATRWDQRCGHANAAKESHPTPLAPLVSFVCSSAVRCRKGLSRDRSCAGV
jgi:hypothetical protein